MNAFQPSRSRPPTSSARFGPHASIGQRVSAPSLSRVGPPMNAVRRSSSVSTVPLVRSGRHASIAARASAPGLAPSRAYSTTRVSSRHRSSRHSVTSRIDRNSRPLCYLIFSTRHLNATLQNAKIRPFLFAFASRLLPPPHRCALPEASQLPADPAASPCRPKSATPAVREQCVAYDELREKALLPHSSHAALPVFAPCSPSCYAFLSSYGCPAGGSHRGQSSEELEKTGHER
jgi:hypothetical protein